MKREKQGKKKVHIYFIVTICTTNLDVCCLAFLVYRCSISI